MVIENLVNPLNVISYTFYMKIVDFSYHNLMMKARSFNEVVIVSVNSKSYKIYFLGMRKNEAANRLKTMIQKQKMDLNEVIILIIIFLSILIKIPITNKNFITVEKAIKNRLCSKRVIQKDW